MKSTGEFKAIIENHLKQMGQSDPQFKLKLEKKGKNIEDCITYILNCVKSSGCNGFADNEIFGMALHYYDEEKVEIGKPISCSVVVNHSVDLSEEEKEKAKEEAWNKVMKEEMDRLRKKASPSKKQDHPDIVQSSLF